MDRVEFRALQREWYQKLHESGFVDIEYMCSDRMYFKNEHRRRFRTRGKRDRDMWQKTFIEAKTAYYLDLTQKVNDPNTKFKSEVDRIIMVMHAEGFSKPKIIEFLAAFGIKRHRHTLIYLIRRYEHEWGLKKYTRRELNKKPKPFGPRKPRKKRTQVMT